MSNLLILQKNFLESFEGTPSFEKHIKIKGVSVKSRLSVYYSSIIQTLLRTLTLTYPLTWKLIGEDCADGAAYAFISKISSLPRSGNLDEWGASFPNFLEEYPPTQPLKYLPDFARFEWLKHKAYGAEESSPLTISALQEIDPKYLGNIIFKLHPSAQLFSSPFPLDEIMAVVTGAIESVTLENRRANVLIIRPDKAINIHWISESYFSFFSMIWKGTPLIKILENIYEDEFSFDKFLSFSLRNGVFSDYAIHNNQ